jgi:hypothetical protein
MALFFARKQSGCFMFSNPVVKILANQLSTNAEVIAHRARLFEEEKKRQVTLILIKQPTRSIQLENKNFFS